MTIALVIGSLGTGGAERQIVLLANALAGNNMKVCIISFFAGGYYENCISERENLTRKILFSRRGRTFFFRVLQNLVIPLRLRTVLKQVRPSIVYSMLEFSNLYAWYATRGKLRRRLVWGYRSSQRRFGWKMGMADRLCIFLSPTVPLLVANSRAGLSFALHRGYRPKRTTVTWNGIDTDSFYFDRTGGEMFRREFSISESAPLIAIIGSISPMKDHSTFLLSVSKVLNSIPESMFVCVGGPHGELFRSLKRVTEKTGIKDCIIWTGVRTDLRSIYSAANVVVSSSAFGEGFSNVIGEAMACETPCVVTNVGDSAWITGDTGRVVPPKNPECLADAVIDVLLNQPARCSECRDRIVHNFSVDSLTINTLTELRSISPDL